ncbi:TolC family protein [Botrimarina hoheduenensis]|uniref:Outer membrane efflux protein n=1 Tax=Botrimarina hoheduenensis TaxID=2528000 RepID=A0A5C5VTE4_9BACT|nr:TolC family protein [Botrimarina hoheduenensis]TWT41397.1 Outer membrane efflux protein [Botrimarina hoheduenensis]
MPQFTLPRTVRATLALLTAAVVLASLSGCSRSRARRSADREAYCLIDQKSVVAGKGQGSYRIGIDPCSRMHDENDPDCPPMPPDDPLSHRYMECVDNKRGAKCWREAPRTPYVEARQWRSCLPLDERGKLVLDTEGAVRLGLLHDPGYQRELEELYLSALDVAFERFRFDTQLFGGVSAFYEVDGALDTSNVIIEPSDFGNRWRLQRLTATGGELTVGLANSLVWQLAGTDSYRGSTLLDFSLVQPLLRGGGRVRVMERLTVAERTLLANVRAMERFQREYYLQIVTGRFASGGPQRRGGLLGGAGLTNFTGVAFGVGGGGGGFGGFGNGGGAGAAGAGGYLGLLQTQQVLRNQRANVAGLRESTQQLEATYDAGRIDRFQVDLARQALFNAQSVLLSAEANYQTSLDNFLTGLGLPPDLPLVVRDRLLDQFNLLEPRLTDLQNATSDALQRIRVVSSDSDALAQGIGPALVAAPPKARDEDEILPEPLVANPLPALLVAEARELMSTAIDLAAAVEADLQRLHAVAPARKTHLLELATREEVSATNIDLRLVNPERLDERIAALDEDFASWAQSFEKLAVAVADLSLETNEDAVAPLLARLSAQLLELSLLQARARLDTIDIEPTEITSLEAMQIARVRRRDWANARASLVDSWRLVHFNANDLQSAVDIVVDGEIGSTTADPFPIGADNGRLSVGLEFDSPTSRLAERNVYRQSLIEYQQARRNYYRFVDGIHQSLRGTLRQVRLNEVNLELRREAVFVAIAQVDLTRLRLSEPPKPGEEDQFNNTTARDLVQALGDLLNAQNDLLSVWVNNRVQRLNLELDLGLMLVDSEGLRVDIDQPLRSFVPDGPCPGGADVREVLPLGQSARTDNSAIQAPQAAEAPRSDGALLPKQESSAPLPVPPAQGSNILEKAGA